MPQFCCESYREARLNIEECQEVGKSGTGKLDVSGEIPLGSSWNCSAVRGWDERRERPDNDRKMWTKVR